jgi:hypothetical protein
MKALHMRRLGHALVPADPQSARLVQRLPEEGIVEARVQRRRSHAALALYWAVLERVVEATGRWRTPEELHNALKIATGRIDKVRLLDGRLVLVPGSIAFDAMSQDEAERYYEAAYRIVCDEIMGGIEIADLLDHVGAKKAA